MKFICLSMDIWNLACNAMMPEFKVFLKLDFMILD